MAVYLIMDTSNKHLAVGIADETKVLLKKQYYAWQKQSELTIKEIAQLLCQLQLSPNAITHIVVTNGPGSYTGIRIALTIAKTWALTKKVGLIVLSSLQALAGLEDNVLALIDARSKRLYAGFYHRGLPIKDDTILTIDEVKELLDKYQLIGDLSILGFEDKTVDLIENMYQLVKISKLELNVHQVKPVYLKD